MYSPRYNTSLIMVLFFISSLHCECLSCACLSICKDGSIIAFKHAFQDWKGSLFKNRLLQAVHAKGGIKGKIPWWGNIGLFWMRILNRDFAGGLINVNNHLMVSFSLLLVWRTTPYDDLDSFSFWSYFGWHNLNIWWRIDQIILNVEQIYSK
jgi:hypothetical protein